MISVLLGGLLARSAGPPPEAARSEDVTGLIAQWEARATKDVAAEAEKGDPIAQLVFGRLEWKAAREDTRRADREYKEAGMFFQPPWAENARFAEKARSIPIKDLERRGSTGDVEALWMLKSLKNDAARERALQGFKWIERAALQGLPQAQYEAGLRLTADDDLSFMPLALPLDFPVGIAWLEKAAGAGVALASGRLAPLYLTGRFVPRDTDAAIRHLQICADANYPGAFYHLAVHYAMGDGEPRGPDEAPLPLLRRAARGKVNEARWELGDRYRHGLSVVADPVEAAEWYCRANIGRERGYSGDEWRIETLFSMVKPDMFSDDDLRRETPPFERLLGVGLLALRERDPKAMAALGRLYLKRKQSDRASIKACGWLRLAVEAGNASAEQDLKEVEGGLSREDQGEVQTWISDIKRELEWK
jgi:TPR repeat protein